MTTTEKIAELRRIMQREKIDAYIISGTDPHNSEYLPLPWKQRQWFSGFTGSFGTLVVTLHHVGLWTDSRYFIQAGQQLAGTEIQLHKLRIPDAVDYPEWLRDTLPVGSAVGLDAYCMMVQEVRHLQKRLQEKEITLHEKIDLLGEIWLDRPALPGGMIRLLPPSITGESTADKLEKVRNHLIGNNGNYILFSALDEIAWLFNLRCDDISYNPVAIAYAIVDRHQAHLFIKPEKVDLEILQALDREGVLCHDYHHLSLFLADVPNEGTFIIDNTTCNYAVFNQVSRRFSVLESPSPVVLMKAVKNETELAGFREACRKDGVALTRFFYWLENSLLAGERLTELDAAARLSDFRALESDFVSDSFHYISAYGKNAALPHYAPTPDKQDYIEPKGLYLIDSGGQYLHGTTDITRTVPVGELTLLEKEDYTLVLKGMIGLSRLIFPRGTRGCNMDIVARLPLYMASRNYGHGTGHGIGHFLNVHEGPQSIRAELKDQEILPGMVTSDEPGLYREGLHGIRHENLIVAVPHVVNEFGEFYRFETITRCYFDTSALDVGLLSPYEITWINDYNQTVYDAIAPSLEPDIADWLRQKTAPLPAARRVFEHNEGE